MIDSKTIRKLFTEYFVKKGHTAVVSSSLVPGNDPTLLFTNSGMVQFKDVFLGTDKRPYTRATTVQRCVRAGGKHNDLENVGYTARHHTFFEMLGNFSFGDYFKRDAIHFAWEFLTEVVKLPKDKLWITVYEQDTEAADIWLKELGVDPNRFSRIGTKDNFWQMGDTGPCGPCTEIFYDHGPNIAGGPPGTPEADGDRYIEIWNLVFMQYNRDAAGNLHPLPKPSVDTGMGLERLAAVLQGVHDNYDIDTFQHLIKAIMALGNLKDHKAKSLRVIADHIRSCAFLVADGVVPSNEGRGYVLRRIIRRAIRHGNKLGLVSPFFYQLVSPLVAVMGEAYPELMAQQNLVEQILKKEEEQFSRTLEQGLRILEQAIEKLSGKQLDGETVFKLYDTYGFPVDLTADIARERGLSIDEAGFEVCMEQQRNRARAASHFNVDYHELAQVDCDSHFVGYEQLYEASEVVALLHEGKQVNSLKAGQQGQVVLAVSPFYAESGGQVGDKGMLTFSGGEFDVLDTKKQGSAIFHQGIVKAGEIKIGTLVQANVDANLREQTARNHSATHLLHAALRKVLGAHVEQKGSSVAPERLRFDFTHHAAMSAAQMAEVEREVNAQIRRNLVVDTVLTNPEQAKAMGAMALFGEKYGDEVRVLKMGDFSMELCGGTHVKRTGDIGLFKILSESGIAAGVRRIEAVTGEAAVLTLQEAERIVLDLAQQLKAPRDSLSDKFQQLLDKQKKLEKEIDALKAKVAGNIGADLANQALSIGDVKVLASQLDSMDGKTLRDLVEKLRNQLKNAVVVLGSVNDSQVSLVAGVSKDLSAKLKAGELINFVAQQVGGKGGGKPDMAQAGGSEPQHLPKALESVSTWVKERI
jgi:alanyl-tRNA synthetase